VTDKSLPDFSSTEDRGKTKVGLVPPKSGTVFRIVDFAPDSQGEHPADMNHMMKIVGAEAPKRGLPPRHPMMHRTRSLDYAIILSGEIDMLLDDGEVRQGGRRRGAAGDQPRLGEPQRQALPRRIHPDGFAGAVKAPPLPTGMKLIGIVGGIGPESTIDYYRLFISTYRERKPDGGYPPVVINSIDLAKP